MTWPNGKRQFKWYDSCEESYKDMARIWEEHYGGMPTYAKAKKWTGSDRSAEWLNNVNYWYINL